MFTVVQFTMIPKDLFQPEMYAEYTLNNACLIPLLQLLFTPLLHLGIANLNLPRTDQCIMQYRIAFSIIMKRPLIFSVNVFLSLNLTFKCQFTWTKTRPSPKIFERGQNSGRYSSSFTITSTSLVPVMLICITETSPCLSKVTVTLF